MRKLCRDCGTDKVIKVKYEDNLETVLCSSCVTMRAQLQTMKEDKLSFPKLLVKIRNETERRIRDEIKRARLLEYRGVNPYAHFSVSYWVEQFGYRGE